MKLSIFWIFALLVLWLPAEVLSAEQPAKTGIVKGNITIDGRPTADVVVSVEGLPQNFLNFPLSAVMAKRTEMDQQETKLIPHVLPILVGTTVDFPNHDKNWHNIYSDSEAKTFDLGLFPPGESRSVTFDKPGVVRILCNVHPNMEAFIVVKNHPYFSAADQRGNYRVNSVPLGQFRLVVWHPELGTQEVSVELAREGEVLDINIDLKKTR